MSYLRYQTGKPCVHCVDRPACRPFGLCRPCHGQPDVRDRFKPAIDPGDRCPACKTHKSQPSRRGGLCFKCSLNPAVRNRIPITSKYARKGLGLVGTAATSGRPIPCPYPPGSVEKLTVLILRAAAGQDLFHPADPPDWVDAAATPIPSATNLAKLIGENPCDARQPR